MSFYIALIQRSTCNIRNSELVLEAWRGEKEVKKKNEREK